MRNRKKKEVEDAGRTDNGVQSFGMWGRGVG